MSCRLFIKERCFEMCGEVGGREARRVPTETKSDQPPAPAPKHVPSWTRGPRLCVHHRCPGMCGRGLVPVRTQRKVMVHQGPQYRGHPRGPAHVAHRHAVPAAGSACQGNHVRESQSNVAVAATSPLERGPAGLTRTSRPPGGACPVSTSPLLTF